MPVLLLEQKGEHGEFIQLHPIDMTDTEVICKCSNGSTLSIKTTDCFLFEDDGQQASVPLSSGDAVEMFRQAENCWWPAKVVNIKGGFVTCSLQGTYEQEVADRDSVRPAGVHRPLSSVQLHTCVVQLPPAFSSHFPQPTKAEIVAELCSSSVSLSGPCLIFHDGEAASNSNAYSVTLATPSEADAKRLTLLSGLLGYRLRWKAAAKHDLDEMARSLSAGKSATSSDPSSAAASGSESHSRHGAARLLEEFPVPSHLVGLALGPRGCNAAEARQLPGVTYVNYDNAAGVFRIFGRNAESAAATWRKT